MKFIKKIWPFLFIVFLWFIFSSPYFIKGKVPYPSTYQVNFFPPWASYEQFHSPIKNNAMPDVVTQIYPWKKLTIDTYKLGQLPLWNPYNFSGNPQLANVQSAVLTPFNFLFLFMPFVDAWSALILMQPFLAGIFMYLMLRSFRRSKVASLVGAVSFMFCGFLTVWMAYGTLSFAILYLPLAVYSCQKFLLTNKKIFLFILALTVPLSFFSGHFQISLYFLAGVVAFIIFKSLENKNSYVLFSSVFSGLILSLPQLLPSLGLYENSVRSSSFITPETIPFQYLPTIFAPDFFGNPVTRNDWFGHYAEWSSFVGIIPFFLSFFSILKKNKDVSFFLILGLVSLILALDTPLSAVIVSLKIPVISTSSLSRIIVLSSFSAAALSAFGLDNLMEVLKKDIRKFYKISILALFVISFLILIPVLTNIPHDKLQIAIKSLRIPLILLLGLFFAIFIGLKVRLIRFLPFVILIAVSIQSFYFAYKWMPFDPKNFVFPQLSVIETVKKNIGYGRMFGNFGAEISSYYDIPSIEGYDPLFIQRYGEFIHSADNGNFANATRSVVKISRQGEQMNRALDLLGVNLIFHPVADTNQGWAFPVWEDPKRFTKVFEDNKFQIFKNNTALSRAQLFYDYEIIKEKQEIIKRFYDNQFDFRNKLILEDTPGLRISKGTGTATIISYTPDKVAIKVNTSTPALLFLSDNYYAGWKAFVKGKETKIFRADYTFRAIAVPDGESEVLFTFEPGL